MKKPAGYCPPEDISVARPVRERLARRVAEKAARKLGQQSEKQVGVWPGGDASVRVRAESKERCRYGKTGCTSIVMLMRIPLPFSHALGR